MAEKTKNGENRAAEGNGRDTFVLPAEAEIAEMPLAEAHKKLEEAVAALEEKQRALEEKEKEAAEFKDKYLRALAEADNSRKRIRQQSEESMRIQREALLRDLLSIIDNLERAVAAARDGGNGKPIVEGVEMVLRSMVDFLRGHGVTQVSAVGQPFDPLLHEAVDSVESTKHEPNTVVDEFVRGYYIGDRLLRPARVAVSRLPGPAGEHGSGDGEG
ncbi:MAG TPA: nucleotide exchange factor GrpE [Candidatus Binataceae bacterium]|jgi:molecular chaperone GrpE|nr:nucleotide exchange factor GrpE [Candidatus Binataceae bacterium]